MKTAELRETKTPELYLQLEQLRRHLFDLRAQAVTEKLENPHQLGNTRKQIARTLTVLRERGDVDVRKHR